jgi:hypothetical protein
LIKLPAHLVCSILSATKAMPTFDRTDDDPPSMLPKSNID